MEPAQTIISLLGGPSAVSRCVGVHRTRVSNWCRPRAVGGTDGFVPQKHIPALIRVAREKGIELSADDFFPSAAASNAASPQASEQNPALACGLSHAEDAA